MIDLKSCVRTIPDYPKPGIQFRDVTTLLQNGDAFHETINRIYDKVKERRFYAVAGIEARGFVLAGPIAWRLNAGLVLIRKENKLPGRTIGVSYALEYGEDHVEIDVDSFPAGAEILLIDDLIATGGTAMASVALIRQAGGTVDTAEFIIDLPDLGGSSRLESAGVHCSSLMQFSGD